MAQIGERERAREREREREREQEERKEKRDSVFLCVLVPVMRFTVPKS